MPDVAAETPPILTAPIASARRELFIGFLIFLPVLSLIYITALTARFATADDYCNLLHAHEPFYEIFIAQGRLVEAGIAAVTYRSINTIAGLAALRFLGIVNLAILATALFHALRRRAWSRQMAWLSALMFCCLPSFQVYITMAEDAAMPLAAAIAGCGAMLVVSKRPGQFILAVILLGISLMIYQPAAMFFWVFAAIELFLDRRDAGRQFIRFGVVAVIGLAAGWVAFKFGGHLMPFLVAPTRGLLSPSEVPAKIRWFITEPLKDALNFFNIFPHPGVAVITYGLIALGMILYFPGTFERKFALCWLAAAMIPMSYLPNLLTSENWASYRTQCALAGLLLIYALIALRGYAQLFKARPFILLNVFRLGALYAAVSCALTVAIYITLPMARELTFVRGQIDSLDLAGIHQIKVIPSNWNDGTAPGARYDEFGITASSAGWGAPAIASLILREDRPDFPGITVILAQHHRDEIQTIRNGDILRLDLRALRAESQKQRP